MYICGDFNSRCRDMLEFIEGVDVVTDRDVIDFGINMINKYSHLFIAVLLNCNTCMLNGRNYVTNDFTCLTEMVIL